MASYAGPINAIEISMSPGDWEGALKVGLMMAAQRVDNTANTFWPPGEDDAMGLLCQRGFARYLGQDHEYVFSPPGPMVKHEPDVCGYEVKSLPWARAEHMDRCEGGRVFVPDHTRAEVIAVMTCFRQTRKTRVFFDGWIYTKQALRYPYGGRIRGQSGQRAHVVPYVRLNPPLTLPPPGRMISP